MFDSDDEDTGDVGMPVEDVFGGSDDDDDDDGLDIKKSSHSTTQKEVCTFNAHWKSKTNSLI